MDSTQVEKADDIKNRIEELRSYSLKRDITKMRQQNMDNYKQHMMQTFTETHQKYPTLFFKVIEDPSSFSMNRLNELLHLMRRMENNEINHDIASQALGQKYYNEFVDGKINKK